MNHNMVLIVVCKTNAKIVDLASMECVYAPRNSKAQPVTIKGVLRTVAIMANV